MDRQSFIRNKYLEEDASGICQTDVCECDESKLAREKQVLNQTRSFGLAALTMMVFLCTIFFAVFRMNATKTKIDQWLLAKKNAIISCSPSRSGNANRLMNNNDKELNDHGSINNKDPGDKNNGNGCTHQQGANSLCETTNTKRRIFIHTC